MTAAADQLDVALWAIAAILACSVLVALVIFAVAIRLHLADLSDRRAAKRARVDILERRYRENLAARNSRPNVVLHINQRRVARSR